MYRLLRHLQSLPINRLVGPLAVALAIMVLVITEMGIRNATQLEQNREAALGLRLELVSLRRHLLLVESSLLRYLLTPSFLLRDRYEDNMERVSASLASLRQLMEQQREQHPTLEELLELANIRAREMQEVIRLVDASKQPAAINLLLNDMDQAYLKRFYELADSINEREHLLFRAAGVERVRVMRWTRIGVVTLVILWLWAIFAMLKVGRERERERQQYLRDLQAERDKLESEVEKRMAELTDLARHLQRVREHERSHLARELHDELGGLLTAAKLDVARLKKPLQSTLPDLVERLSHLSSLLDQGIALKRRIIEDLRPSSLSTLGLSRALEILCQEFAQRSELQLQLDIEEVQMEAEAALSLYRLVQEALTNIAKYAQARQVHVSLHQEEAWVRVRVRDDGQGFDPTQLRPGTHGLQGMRFRVRSCAGQFRLYSRPGEGTTIEALLPRQ
ncbi:sensor histidine kinase [Balneatrix alpica]|uniref:ATP-binding protein n=1 Tax=Balneatrix alpica TaxID=75684 RepID=A0ABV5Z9U5_9GAMM|nr:ATP-binding protein [Balneatrix alpica]